MKKKNKNSKSSQNGDNGHQVLTRKRSRDITQEVEAQYQENSATKPKKTNKFMNMNQEQEEP